MKKTLTLLIILFSFFIEGQQLPFQQVYNAYPSIPAGLLETVSWTRTRMHNMHDTLPKGCLGMPRPYGVMGLFNDGGGHFIKNGQLVADISGISVAQQKSSVLSQIMAYAAAFKHYYSQTTGEAEGLRVYKALLSLSELPNNDAFDRYARDVQVYEVLSILSLPSFAEKLGFLPHHYDLKAIFSTTNFNVLSSHEVIFSSASIQTKNGVAYQPRASVLQQATPRSSDYGPAISDIISCNYNTRPNGANSISAVTIHDMEGSYAGSISWFHNCSSSVSAHYCLRSSDGQITQCVPEYLRAWHVGSENDYTIGLEHEGYVNQTGWYTVAMYQSSAALVRDICNDYGINPKRTAFWPWTGTTYYNQSGIPGACSKIKGHQHYPNQTHNDPGPNWDWDYYYKLINNSTTPTTLTSATGSLFDSGGASGNYSSVERKIWVIQPNNAGTITLNFSSFNLEDTWDYLYIYDGNNVFSPLIGSYTGTNSPGTITSSGGSITIEFRSDCATTAAGWGLSWTSVTPDIVPPSTTVSPINNWATADFTASFTDSDNSGGSGVATRFYQVLYYDGSTWLANANRGFFGDNFDGTSILANWTSETGTWSVSSGNALEQSDESNGNTNIHAPLNQLLSNSYLYTWQGKISGTGTNRRAGFHFFCDDPTQTNRGNSYFVYFRADNDKVQIYKVVNNVFTLEVNNAYTINADQWYNFKVVFNRISGNIQFIIDGNLVAQWQDASPLTTGNAVSFRSGNCVYEVDNFKAYRSRGNTATIKVGAGIGNDAIYQNINPSTPAAKIKSVVIDNAGNLSSIAYQFANIDWTPPQDSTVNDGIATDIDTLYSSTVNANWSGTNDPNSGIVGFEVAIGTSPNAANVVPWNTNGTAASFSHVLSSPVYNQIYYVSVRSENGAGLVDTVSSDGQRYLYGLETTESLMQHLEVYPNPVSNLIFIKNISNPIAVSIYDMAGKLVIKQSVTPQKSSIDVHQLAQGSFSIVFQSGNQFIVKKFIHK